MLIVKESTKLEELTTLGFSKRYDEYTGELVKYVLNMEVGQARWTFVVEVSNRLLNKTYSSFAADTYTIMNFMQVYEDKIVELVKSGMFEEYIEPTKAEEEESEVNGQNNVY